MAAGLCSATGGACQLAAPPASTGVPSFAGRCLGTRLPGVGGAALDRVQRAPSLYLHGAARPIHRHAPACSHFSRQGKELIENLTVLRFANLVFEPLWSRQYIRNVQVCVCVCVCWWWWWWWWRGGAADGGGLRSSGAVGAVSPALHPQRNHLTRFECRLSTTWHFLTWKIEVLSYRKLITPITGTPTNPWPRPHSTSAGHLLRELWYRRAGRLL